jgi:preprotein translocase subunit SecB
MAEQEKQISIQKIYTKDFSFESPQAPSVFTKSDWEPKTNLNLRSTHSELGDNNHDVVLTLTVETKHEDKTLFLVELHQAGIFNISGYEGEELAAILGSFCPSTLFPYARETIASMVAKGGFPEFILQPINFDSLYAQTLQQAATADTAAAGNGGTH